jgi:hypothetical protein
MSKRARANTAGDTSVVTADTLLKSLASITIEAQANLGTNPNADPLGLVLLDGCEDAVDEETYPDDSNYIGGDEYIKHSFKKTHPKVFIPTAPGHCMTCDYAYFCH